MIWVFVILIVSGSVCFVAYPLFTGKLQIYELSNASKQNISLADSWLAALYDLEDDLSLGRVSEFDYQRQKIFLQRGYLEFKKNP